MVGLGFHPPPTNGWDLLASLGHPSNFSALPHGILVAGVSQTFTALNRGRHLYSAGRPSRWALAHILVNFGTPIYRWKWWRWMLQVWYKILLWWQMHRYIGASCARDEIRNVKERNNDKERKHTVRGMGIRPYYPRRRLRGSSKCQLLNRNPLSGFVKTVTKL